MYVQFICMSDKDMASYTRDRDLFEEGRMEAWRRLD